MNFWIKRDKGVNTAGIGKRYSVRGRQAVALERASNPAIGLVGLFFFLAGQVVLPMAAQAQVARTPAPKPPSKPAPAWAKERESREAIGSLPGKVKPSEDSGCTDCEVTMQALDLKRVPTEKELRMAGQLGGALDPIGNADVLKLEAALDAELADQGVSRAAAAKAGPNTPAGKLHRLKTEKVERLKKINHTFGAAIQEWNKHNFRKAAGMFDKHVKEFPDSPWAGEALLHLGCDAKYNGRFSEAQSRYDAILKSTEVTNKRNLKKQVAATGDIRAEVSVVDSSQIHWKAKARWADLDLAVGRLDDALTKLRDIAQNDPDWRRKTWARSWIITSGLFKANAKDLRACGSQALSVVLAELDKPAAAQKVAQMHPKTEEGFSLSEMQAIAGRNGVTMRGFKATGATQLVSLPTPFIVHYDFAGLKKVGASNDKKQWLGGSSLHGFAALPQSAKAVVKKPVSNSKKLVANPRPSASPYRIKAQSPDHFLVVQKVDAAQRIVKMYDPLEKRFYQLSFAELEREWSGKGLMPAKGGTQIAALPESEMKSTRGGCCGSFRASPGEGCDENNDNCNGSCGSGGGGGRSSGGGGFSLAQADGTSDVKGSPVISVNKGSLNVFIADTPLWYSTPKGPDVEITVSYNSQDSLTQASPVGRKWTLNYRSYIIEDTQFGGGIMLVFRPDGAKESYYPNGSGGYNTDVGNHNKLTKLSDTRYEVTYPGGDKAIYDYPAGATHTIQSLLVELKDRWGYSLMMGYEEDDTHTNLTTITDAAGKVTRLSYDNKGQVVRVTDPFERQASFAYDSNDNMVECVDMEGNAFQYTYTGVADVTQLKTAQGNWNISSYIGYPDAATAVTDPQGKTERWYYSAWGSSTYSYTDKRGKVHGYSMDAVVGGKGRVTAMRSPYVSGGIDGEGGSGGLTLQSTNYNYSTGGPSQITNERGKTTSIAYNSQGQPTSVTDPKNQTITFAYAGNGLDLTSITNTTNTTVATYTYDTFHQPTSLTDAFGKTTQMTYTAWGAPATLTDASNVVTAFHYDTAGQLTSLSRGGSTFASFTYDAIGRVRTRTDAAGLTLTYDYNNLDKVTKVTFPDNTTVETEYVCCGMPGVVKDRSGRKSYYDYDPMKQLTRMQDAAGNSVQLDYDGNGNHVRLIDGKGNVTRWQYDDQNRLVRKIYHDGTDEEYEYNSGLLWKKTSAKGQVTQYGYDDNGNLSLIDYPNMADVAIAYNALDRPSSMVDGTGTHTFGYDGIGRLTSVDGPWANDTVAYGYDDLGRRSALGVQRDATSVDQLTYAYDALSRLQSITSTSGTFGYTYVGNTGMVQQLSLPNGTKAEYSYDGVQRLTQVHNKTQANANISKYAYGYDNQDVRAYVEQTVGNEPMQRVNFGYDTVDQLVSEVSAETPVPDVNRSYAYDAMGNRTASQTVSASDTVQSSYAANKLNQYTTINASWNNGTESSAATLTYDASGNLTQMASVGTSGGSTSDYTFDDADRLARVIRKDGSGVNEHKSEYSYDGLSRLRVSKEYSWTNGAWVLQSTKGRVYDGLNVVQERDDTNAVLAFYTRGQDMGGGIGGLLSRSTPSGQSTDHFYYHYDGGGNVVQLTDSQQATVAEYKYSAFGSLIASRGAQASSNPYRFSTKEFHGNTGLYDYGYRFYSPGLGRWSNRDPIQETGGVNIYAFAGNSPVHKMDADGLFLNVLAGAAAGGVLGGAVGGFGSFLAGGSPCEIATAAAAGGIMGAVAGGLATLPGGAVVITPSIFGAVQGGIQQLLTEVFCNRSCTDLKSAVARIIAAAGLGLVTGFFAGKLNLGFEADDPIVPFVYNAVISFDFAILFGGFGRVSQGRCPDQKGVWY